MASVRQDRRPAHPHSPSVFLRLLHSSRIYLRGWVGSAGDGLIGNLRCDVLRSCHPNALVPRLTRSGGKGTDSRTRQHVIGRPERFAKYLLSMSSIFIFILPSHCNPTYPGDLNHFKPLFRTDVIEHWLRLSTLRQCQLPFVRLIVVPALGRNDGAYAT